MLSIQQSDKSNSIVPNVLPCEISHTGKIDNVKRFWNPQAETVKDANDSDVQTKVAYFRGRKLLGRTTELPKGYRGVVVGGEKQFVLQQEPQKESAFSRIARREADESDGYDDANVSDVDEQPNVQHEAMNEISTFDKVTVWEHESIPDTQEPFTRGIEEWLSFAQTIHNTDS